MTPQLLNSTIGALHLARATQRNQLPSTVREAVITKATQAAPHIRDLFERFLPEQERTQRLGHTIDLQQILALNGDVERGRYLFFDQSGVQCQSCHRIDKRGHEVGPDLDSIGKTYDQTQILTSILEPSRKIDAKYLQYHCVTTDGRTLSGILVEKTDQFVVLKDAKVQTVKVAAEDVELLAAQSKSMMPELLVRDLTAQQVADLVAFLDSLE